jgi:plastocyanin
MKISKVVSGCLSLLVLSTAALHAATHTVAVRNNVFVPATVRIKTGDTVRWVWESGTHDVVSNVSGEAAGSRFRSPLKSSGDFSVTFSSVANIPYYCTPHRFQGMVGTVIVEAGAANASPTVSITSPTTGATFSAPASFTINANAADTDGTVSAVEFRVGNIVLPTDTAAPYTAQVSNLAAGNYVITAVALDNLGARATNTVNITVNAANVAPNVTLTSPANNTSVTAGTPVQLTATASDSDGSVARVVFLVNGTAVATNTVAPYQFNLVMNSTGSYQITAQATDNNGSTSTSAAATLTVTAPTNVPQTRILPPTLVENGTALSIIVSNTVLGVSYELQSSSDLTSTNWTSVTTTSASGSSFETKQPVTGEKRFFRILKK